ncbi:flagellin lysine-N-methylase [[Clostridium] aminophilum]|uniref:Lysine-N-methylase n=1 Tax=[Clostridium] aminophilum TaxID=1526 RepID=A0A1I6KM77_9FIRM|nr:flagellin lysine-N-methylase [[Clostridium] aminophilum]SFR92327.1 hypothetical protein SAMN02910262_02661 [[Clostridium] aminophilum]
MSEYIRPDYQDSFHCIADRCSFTCCCEWKISVDPDTRKRWQTLRDPDHQDPLLAYTDCQGEECSVRLLPDHCCPFLDVNRLCRLVRHYGEEILSETCHIFPRQIHEFPDRTESSMVSCCPEIIDRWVERDHLVFYISKLPDNAAVGDIPPSVPQAEHSAHKGTNPVTVVSSSPRAEHSTHEQEPAASFAHLQKIIPGRDSIPLTGDFLRDIRNLCMSLAADTNGSCEEHLMQIFYILKEIDTSRSGAPDSHSRIDLTEYGSPAYGNDLLSAIRRMPTDPESSLWERNELFLDLSENYRKEGLYRRFLDSACETAEDLEGYSDVLPAYTSFLAVFHKWQPLMRNFLVSEIFSSLLVPEDLEDPDSFRSILIRTEWIAMEYSAILHMLFLSYIRSGCSEISYETVRDSMILISRMTGYDEEDIEEYMENSFENAVWDWGYLALILS